MLCFERYSLNSIFLFLHPKTQHPIYPYFTLIFKRFSHPYLISIQKRPLYPIVYT
jgi:hypothetical protein